VTDNFGWLGGAPSVFRRRRRRWMIPAGGGGGAIRRLRGLSVLLCRAVSQCVLNVLVFYFSL